VALRLRHDQAVSALDLDFEQCYCALESRDPRFDGLFIVGVRTTGVYCRPSCPSPVIPKRRNVSFYRTAAAAQLSGLRACKRCRPDAVPGSPEWDGRSDVVARAMRLIGDGAVDREGVQGLARQLAVSERQLQRLLVASVGAPALALARARRAHTARLLIEGTVLPFVDIAFAAGFTSVRQFNATIREIYGATPSELRAGRTRASGTARTNRLLQLRLPLRAPWQPKSALLWLAARSTPGVEEVRDGSYRRALHGHRGVGFVTLEPHSDHVLVSIELSDIADLGAAVDRCRRLFDLDADPEAVAAVLARDGRLRGPVAAQPGLRVLGTVDPAETAIRAVLGQQVSVAAARTLASRLVLAVGKPLDAPAGLVTHAFPGPDAIAEAELESVGLPQARRRTLREIATRLAGGRLDLGPGADRVAAKRELLAIPGVGEWTATYISLRALRDPDAFPAMDIGIRRGARALGLSEEPPALAARAARWRPWRSYAAHYLWAAGS
jgi:AraC family transcriptional regulator of adaptative response / DNA-3-methyladenine glycosylase II